MLWKDRPISALAPLPRSRGRVLVGAGPYGLYRLRISTGGRARLLRGHYVRALAWRGRDLLLDTPTRRCVLAKGSARRRRCRPLPDEAFAPLPGELPSPHVTALTVHDGSLWLGTFDAGLARLGPAGWERIAGSAQDRVLRFVNGLVPDPAGGLWLAGPNGAARLSSGGTWTRYGKLQGLPSDHVNAVLPLGAATWLATSRGVARVEAGEVAHFGPADGLPGRIVYSLASWRGGVVAGTDRGVGVLSGGRWRRFSHEDGSLSDNWVNAVCATSEGLFVGTYDAGVDRIEPSGQAHTEPAGPLWINPSGLHSPAPGWTLAATLGDGLRARRPDGTWVRLAPASVLPSQDVTAARVHAGALWVATRRGVALLAPAARSGAPNPPPRASPRSSRRVQLAGAEPVWAQDWLSQCEHQSGEGSSLRSCPSGADASPQSRSRSGRANEDAEGAAVHTADAPGSAAERRSWWGSWGAELALSRP